MTNEGSLKSAVEGYLTILQNQGKLIFLRLNAGGIVIEGEKRRYFQGAKPGTADLEVIMGGKTIFLELKNKKGELSLAQKAFRDAVRAQGAEFYIVKSLDDLIVVIGRS